MKKKVDVPKAEGMDVRLSKLFGNDHVGTATVIAICDAISADARFNKWFYDCVKCSDNDIPDDDILALLDKSEEINDQCLSAVAAFDQDHDLDKLHVGLQSYREQVDALMVEWSKRYGDGRR